MILLATTALILLLAQQHMLPTLAHLSLGSPLILGLYALAISDLREEPCSSTPSLRTALTGYSLASTVVVARGVWLLTMRLTSRAPCTLTSLPCTPRPP